MKRKSKVHTAFPFWYNELVWALQNKNSFETTEEYEQELYYCIKTIKKLSE